MKPPLLAAPSVLVPCTTGPRNGAVWHVPAPWVRCYGKQAMAKAKGAQCFVQTFYSSDRIGVRGLKKMPK
uniref:Putative secreted protein n=1 Tax=Anopheles marajoara TaxID=58244 RepID=A0A2M4CEQ8_9DIPT